jgi:S-(hydroxymethyl)glutathione dehydrogenase / alcohol dehydrogenase
VRAALVESVPGEALIRDVDIDDPRVGEVLVDTVACGVCHSDLHALHGHPMAMPTPFVLGHEPAGIVAAVGPGVKHVQPGDRVVACLSVYCGHCRHCLTGEAYRCFTDEYARSADAPSRLRDVNGPVHQFVGLSGFAETMLVSQHHVVKVDPSLPLNRACLLGCGVLTGIGAVLRTAQVTQGSSVAVVGCGGVGLSAIQGARLAYAGRIVAVDVDDATLELARRCGATDVVNATLDDPVAAVQSIVPGGVDFAFEAIGRAPTLQQALEMTGLGGTVTSVGILDAAAEIRITGTDLLMGRKIQQSQMGSNRFAADIPALVEHALAGRIDLDALVSEERTLDALPGVLGRLATGQVLGRAVITL